MFAQDTVSIDHNGSIKVQKKAILHSVIYDDVNFRLVCRDIYGNIHDSAVVSFDIKTTVRGIAYAEKTTGPFLSKQMQQRLGRLDGLVVIMFSNIKAKDINGQIISFPNFKAETGKARENQDF
ncbi:MAG: hypothetical protein K0S44_3037 [Bacteroidetes bacterium]|jgi:hypothetical protein|nr:hypothetical protein [Bacteroidota bacterium]